MPSRQTIPKPQKHKHRKRKTQPRHATDLGTPKVPISKNRHQPRHELLREWEDAT